MPQQRLGAHPAGQLFCLAQIHLGTFMRGSSLGKSSAPCYIVVAHSWRLDSGNAACLCHLLLAVLLCHIMT